MKRRALLVGILTLMIWVSGCAADMPAQPVTHSFCSQLTVSGLGEPYVGALTVTEEHLCWELTAPEVVAGCVLTCDGDQVTLTPPDSEPVVADAGRLPAEGFVSVLWNALRTAQPEMVEWENGDGRLTGRVTGGRYQLLSEADSGFLKNLRVEGGEWLAVFTDVSTKEG